MSKSRYECIDLIRGFTVFLMIIFHFFYDLHVFRLVTIDFSRDLFWWSFPRFIVFLFLIAVGMSLALVNHNGIQWSVFWKRFIKIAFFALLISVATYFGFRKNWIYFGTLHCIALASLCALPFLQRPKLSLLTTVAILTPLAFGYRYPFFKLPHQAMDYIPLLPWFAIVTLGIFLFHQGLHLVSFPSFIGKRKLIWLGKHSLKVYIVHQVILFPLVYLLSVLLRNI